MSFNFVNVAFRAYPNQMMLHSVVVLHNGGFGSQARTCEFGICRGVQTCPLAIQESRTCAVAVQEEDMSFLRKKVLFKTEKVTFVRTCLFCFLCLV